MENDVRVPLDSGTVITMKNGGIYKIDTLIGKGGLSLVYSALTDGSTSECVIKEFYPAMDSSGRTYAVRNKNGKVSPASESLSKKFQKALELFESEGIVGGDVASRSFQTLSFWEYSDGYAIMKKESRDMQSLKSLVNSWSKENPIPVSGKPEDADPVFTDLVRLRYALCVTDSILSALSSVHERYLHLDLSSTNVIWACREPDTGVNGSAVITDYGSAAVLQNGEFYPNYQIYSSNGFAAPEIYNRNKLTYKTDLYSVGMILMYLCIGEEQFRQNFMITRRPEQLRREINDIICMDIPDGFLSRLKNIIISSTVDRKYGSSKDMQQDIRDLYNNIPIHPINPDCTKEFTLYSLKSMLEGSKGTHYSWAHELCDRRRVDYPNFPDSIYSRISSKEFKSEDQFLELILPQEIYNFLIKEKNTSISSVLSCNYDCELKESVCRKIKKYGTRGFLVKSRSLMNNSGVFSIHRRLLFDILGDDCERLRRVYNDCTLKYDIRKNQYIGLAMFAIYALLGTEGFKFWLPSTINAGDLFKPL